MRQVRDTRPTDPAWRSTGCSSTGWHAPADTGGSERAQAWTAFWQEQGGDSRCLANMHPEVRKTLDDHWSAVAATLASTARILDIGCGAGAVARALLAARGGLRITGIDLASVPAPADRRLALLPGTAMERLPFEQGAFDVAVSQFGFEYGHVREAAAELARVLLPGAFFSFVVHHGSGSIVRQSRARNRALRALLGEAVGKAMLSGNKADLERQIWSIRHKAPTDTLVGQVGEALCAHVGRDPAKRAAIWSAIAEALAPERIILDALEACCVAPADLEHWLARLSGRLEIAGVSEMRQPSGDAIAWRIEGRRPA